VNVERFSDSNLGNALRSIFIEREGKVADYYDNDPDFSAYPGDETEGKAFPILDNENFAPFGCLYDPTDGSRLNEFVSGQNWGLPQCVKQGLVVKLVNHLATCT